MKQGRVSQTALKVAISFLTLNQKDDWAKRLPDGLVEMSERLLLASGSPGYNPSIMRLAKKRWMIHLYRVQDLMMPGQFEGFGHRKIFVQGQVEAAIEHGARQVLVLGAGFDTLCLRLAPLYPHVQFFEVDHPATSAAKAKGIDLEGQPANMRQIAVDLGEQPLSKVMSQEERWEQSVPSLLVAEGLFQYLTDEEVRGLLVEAAACSAPSSRFVFTHSVPRYNKLIVLLTALIAERWKYGVNSADLPEYVSGTGWKIISDVDDDPAHGVERYAVAERR